MALFSDGYNCSQAVVLAFSDITGAEEKTLVKIASSFGGGMGRLREVCGAVTGAFMVLGLLYGYSESETGAKKAEHYMRIQHFAERFSEETGSIVCRELLGLDKGKYSPVPDERTEQYYKKRPCRELVGLAAGILEEMIENK